LPSEIFDSPKGRHLWPQRTICEVHRQLYDLCVVELSEEQQGQFVPLLEEAYLMGIKLVRGLIDRKLGLPDWAQNNVEQARRLRQARIEMENTLEVGHRLQPAGT